MPATLYNIVVENDADYYRAFSFKDAGGVAIDITGAKLVMKVRRHASDATVFLTTSTDNGDIVLYDPVNGAFTIFIAQGRLAELTVGNYDQSLIITLNGVKTAIWEGLFTVNPGPSR